MLIFCIKTDIFSHIVNIICVFGADVTMIDRSMIFTFCGQPFVYWHFCWQTRRGRFRRLFWPVRWASQNWWICLSTAVKLSVMMSVLFILKLYSLLFCLCFNFLRWIKIFETLCNSGIYTFNWPMHAESRCMWIMTTYSNAVYRAKHIPR